jgi:hypothetical protein
MVGSKEGSSWSLHQQHGIRHAMYSSLHNFHCMRINRAVGLGIAIVVLKLLLFPVIVGMEDLLVAAFHAGEVVMKKVELTASTATLFLQ